MSVTSQLRSKDSTVESGERPSGEWRETWPGSTDAEEFLNWVRGQCLPISPKTSVYCAVVEGCDSSHFPKMATLLIRRQNNSLLECEWAFVTVSTSSKWQTQYYLEDSVIKFHVCPFHQNTLARALSYCGRTARALKVPCYEEAQSTWSTDCIEKPWQEMSSWPSDAPVPATSDCNCMKHSKPNCLAGPFPNYWPRETMTNKETAVVVLSH